MKGLLGGLGGQLRRLVAVRRYRIMLLLLLAASWLSMEIYHRMVITGIPVAVVDYDNSKISRTIRSYLSSLREVRVVDRPLASVDEARRAMVRGELAAVVLIPSDLSRRLKHGRAATVVLAVDMSNILIGKNVYKALAQSVGTVSAGVQLQVVKKLGVRKERALSKVVPIAVEENYSYNPATNYAVYLAPGAIFFFLHVFILILAASLFLPPERPAGAAEAAGRALAIWLTGVGLGLLFFYVFLPREGILPTSPLPLVLGMLAAFVAVDLLMATAVGAVLGTPMFSLQLTVLIGMLSLMFSGITWPEDMFPAPIRAVSHAIPFTPFARALRLFTHYSTTIEDLRGPLTLLAWQGGAYAVIAAVAGAVRKLLPHAARRPA